MRHDNTSAFNCRYVAGTTTWSQHAYGRAIDLNPVENPYVAGPCVAHGGVVATSTGPTSAGDRPARGRRPAFRRIGWGGEGAGPRPRTTSTSRRTGADVGPTGDGPRRASRDPPGVEWPTAWHDDEDPPSSSGRCGGRIPGRSSGDYSARRSAPRPRGATTRGGTPWGERGRGARSTPGTPVRSSRSGCGCWGAREAAEELTQDVFLAAWRKAARFDPARGRLSTWLMTIAHNLAVDRLRRGLVTARTLVLVDEVPGSSGWTRRSR